MGGLRGCVRVVGASLALLLLITSKGVAQPAREGVVAVSLESRLLPALQAFGVGAFVEIHPGLSLTAKVRQVWSSFACTELTPTPCDQDGVGVGLGVLYRSPSAESWWPYVELMAGGHRYTDFATKPFFGLGLGVGRSVGARGSLRLGFQIERINADPAYWSDGASSHGAAGLFIGLGVGVG